MGGLAQQVHQLLQGDLPVAFLRAGFLGRYHEDAVLCELAAGKWPQPGLEVLGQMRPFHVEAQFDGSRDLVHVLAARP